MSSLWTHGQNQYIQSQLGVETIMYKFEIQKENITALGCIYVSQSHDDKKTSYNVDCLCYNIDDDDDLWREPV